MLFWDKLPYQSLAGRQVVQVLEGMGLKVNSLHVDTLTQNGATLSAIDLGDTHHLTVDTLSAAYDWREVQKGKLREVTARKVTIPIRETDTGWMIGGLEPLMDSGADATAPALAPFFDAATLRGLLPHSVTVDDGTLKVHGKALQLSSGFVVATQMAETPQATLTLTKPGGAFGKYALKADALTLQATLDDAAHTWHIKGVVPKLTITGAEQDIPPLAVKMDASVTEKNIVANVTAQDAKNTKKAAFTLSLPLSDPTQGTLRIKSFATEWGGGKIRVKDASVALSMKKPIRIPVQLEKVQLATLLEALGDERIKGTGIVSGTLPIIYNPIDGIFALEDGGFEAIEKGQLQIAPEAIPGAGNENLDVVRTALGNFQYDLLKMSVVSGPDNTPAIRLSVEGKNPEAFNGRLVKLTVTLTGDVLQLIQQSILPINDVKQLLKLQEQQK